jgi:hypothetical protein
MMIHTLVNFAGLDPARPSTASKPTDLTMIFTRLRAIATAAVVLVATAGGLCAQTPPPPAPAPAGPGMAPPAPAAPPQNPVCARLEAQLASVDGGRGDQVRRYEEAAQQQQNELDRTVAQARRAGCEGSGFFLFGRSQAPQCDDLNNRIQRMRTNLDRLNSDLQQLRMSRGSTEGQRMQILQALGQNDCGPQYRTAAAPASPARPRGFFEQLFGGGGGGGGGNAGAPPSPFGSGDLTPSDQSSTYRTICVRTCDGFYFPVSYSTSSTRFRDDEQACQRMCPASEVMLFTYRNPGEDVSQAVSVSTQQPYTSLANAFRYRQEFNPSCSCKRQGESWADTLKDIQDNTVERGDIIVNDETAKQLAQPKPDPRAPKGARASKGEPKAQTTDPSAMPAPVTSAPLPDATAPQANPASPPPASGKPSIRTVGPPFIVR